MFIIYILVGAIVVSAGIGLLYCIGLGLEKIFPHNPITDSMGEPFLTVLLGMMALLITVLVVMVTYLLGAGVIGLFTGGK
jgi:hypothetical protein